MKRDPLDNFASAFVFVLLLALLVSAATRIALLIVQ